MVFYVEGSTIRDAMVAIERGSANAAFAVDQNRVLVGVITDGDIRRALLGNQLFTDPVAPLVQRSPVVAAVSDSRSIVLDLMQSRGISQVPVIDASGRIVAVHLMRELLGRVARPNVAVVLAGGRGARLQPITDSIPKPMVKVAGRPILERIVNHLVGYGIHRIVMSVGYLAEAIQGHFDDGAKYGCQITYIREDPAKPLGTGGPLASVYRAYPDLSHPVLILNGDLVSQFDVASLLRHHGRTKSAATIGTIMYSNEIPFGVLDIDDDGHVKAIAEKPTRLEPVNAGIYILEPIVLEQVPVDAFVPITHVLADCIERGQRVTAWNLEQDWLDVGRPQDLALARGLAQ